MPIEKFKKNEKKKVKKEFDLKINEIDSIKTIEDLAIYLHKIGCKNKHNEHVFACNWYYEIQGEIHDWNRSSHKLWLNKTKEIINL